MLSLIFILLLSAYPFAAQNGEDRVPPAGPTPENRHEDAPAADMRRRQLQELNRRRQEQMKRDSDKLYQLATELKQYVDKTNENILSIEVVKKAEEIEKLAKSVKEKMKTTYVDTP